ncbi:MAG: sensor histidine kinase, partial [Gaiellaceae bacterium]
AADRESCVEMIEEESERLARIVDQILVTGRMDGGDIVLDEAPCDLSGLAASVIESAEVQQPKGIDFALVVAPDLPVVRCDESKLRQVLVNLVENAVKYSPGGGTVEVRLASENGTARIAVRDTGLGIPPGDRERIFEKFFRLDPALARGVGGTGLGLYIVHELVERMGGSVHLESRLGEGSTFEVVLPV